MNDEIKTLIMRKNWLYQRQRRSSNLYYNMLIARTTGTSNAMNSFKFKYHDSLAKTLNDHTKTCKPYWSNITLIRMGFLRFAHKWVRPKRPLSLKSVTHILQ